MIVGIIMTIFFGVILLLSLSRFISEQDWILFFVIIFSSILFFYGLYRIDMAEKEEQPAKVELTQEGQ